MDLRVLGPVEAHAGPRRLDLGGPKQRSLMALLLIEQGRPVTADPLADELWAGNPPAGAATTLRSYVSRLRTTLGSATVIGTSAGYALDVAAEAVDAQRFEELARQGESALRRGAPGAAADRLHAALALWRGPAFAGTSDVASLTLEARRLEEIRLVCLEQRIEADLDLARHGDVVAELQRLVEEEPSRERLWRHLVLALYRCDRQADALDTYRRARERLRDELGLEPSEDLRELERAILNHDLPARPRQHRASQPAGPDDQPPRARGGARRDIQRPAQAPPDCPQWGRRIGQDAARYRDRTAPGRCVG